MHLALLGKGVRHLWAVARSARLQWSPWAHNQQDKRAAGGRPDGRGGCCNSKRVAGGGLAAGRVAVAGAGCVCQVTNQTCNNLPRFLASTGAAVHLLTSHRPQPK